MKAVTKLQRKKTDNQQSDDHKNDAEHHQDANFKTRKCSDHQDIQHSLKVEQDEEMREYRLRDKDRQMMVAVMVDSKGIAEANRSKTTDGNRELVIHKDS